MLIKTVLAMKGICARVAPRSGSALKRRIDVWVGMVDCDYVGEIGVVLRIHVQQLFEINIGHRIPHVVSGQIPMARIVQIDQFDDASHDDHGSDNTGTSSHGTTPLKNDDVASDVSLACSSERFIEYADRVCGLGLAQRWFEDTCRGCDLVYAKVVTHYPERLVDVPSVAVVISSG